MKIYIDDSRSEFGEYISCMAKVGSSQKPPFMFCVYEDGSHIGEPYLKIYDSSKYSSSKRVTRLSLIDGRRIIHRNLDGREEWNIDNGTLKALNDYLKKNSKQYPNYTNWQVLIYMWNYETSFIAEFDDDKYDSYIDAFFDGYYDTEDNLSNPNYMKSDSEQPDFRK